MGCDEIRCCVVRVLVMQRVRVMWGTGTAETHSSGARMLGLGALTVKFFSLAEVRGTGRGCSNYQRRRVEGDIRGKTEKHLPPWLLYVLMLYVLTPVAVICMVRSTRPRLANLK